MLEKSQAGPNPFSGVDMRVRVAGGGHTSQIYAIRQAIAKAIVAYTGKYQDAQTAIELKRVLVAYDRTLLVADPRRMEPKRFGGQGARARYQKSVRRRSSHGSMLTLGSTDRRRSTTLVCTDTAGREALFCIVARPLGLTPRCVSLARVESIYTNEGRSTSD